MQLFETIIYCILLQLITSQLNIEIAFNNKQVQIYSKSSINPSFLTKQNQFDCTDTMYSISQPNNDYLTNTPNIIYISQNNLRLNFSISTFYNHFTPSLNDSQCNLNNCIITIQYNCPQILTTTNYFDVIILTILPLGTFSYELDCDVTYNVAYFQYSGLIIITLATFILIVAANFGRWNSFSGYGIEYGYVTITLVSSSILTVGLLGLYAPAAASIVINIANFLSIIGAVSIVSIQFLFFLKLSNLKTKFKIRKITIRLIDIIGILISIPITLGWWFLGNNWIVSDIISIIMVIAIVKVFKLVSLKIALIAYLIMVSMYSAAAIIISVKFHNIRSGYFISQVYTPFQLQIPLLTPSFSQKCTSVSITTIAFPALLVSYLRRFDQSRSTRIYLITAIFTYFLGSIMWWIANSFSHFPLPFDAFCEPIMIIGFTLFAFKRKQLRTLWQGKFFDEQFQNKSDIQAIGNRIAEQGTKVDHFQLQLITKLFFDVKEDSQICQTQKNAQSRIRNDEL